VQEKKSEASLLLVDDNKNLVITLTDYLIYEGFDVVTAGSGEEALKKLEDVSPDLMILDISMPGIGGVGLLNKLRHDKDGFDFPVLVFTARSTMETFFDELDVAGFVAKPCSESELLLEIKTILEAHPRKAKRPQPKRVLLGENDVELVKALTHYLSIAGYELHIAETGAEVIERAAVLKPQIIVMKDLLPGMNGRLVAPIVRAMPRTKNIPFILYDDTHTIEEEERYGMRLPEAVSQYIASSDPDELLVAIRGQLK
jgi:DNA-binding response OmpR family regulator